MSGGRELAPACLLEPWPGAPFLLSGPPTYLDPQQGHRKEPQGPGQGKVSEFVKYLDRET